MGSVLQSIKKGSKGTGQRWRLHLSGYLGKICGENDILTEDKKKQEKAATCTT